MNKKNEYKYWTILLPHKKRTSFFVTKPLDSKSIPKYKVDKEIFICEKSYRWTSENTDSFYYDIIEENDNRWKN